MLEQDLQHLKDLNNFLYWVMHSRNISVHNIARILRITTNELKKIQLGHDALSANSFILLCHELNISPNCLSRGYLDDCSAFPKEEIYRVKENYKIPPIYSELSTVNVRFLRPLFLALNFHLSSSQLRSFFNETFNFEPSYFFQLNYRVNWRFLHDLIQEVTVYLDQNIEQVMSKFFFSESAHGELFGCLNESKTPLSRLSFLTKNVALYEQSFGIKYDSEKVTHNSFFTIELFPVMNNGQNLDQDFCEVITRYIQSFFTNILALNNGHENYQVKALSLVDFQERTMFQVTRC
jgi:transcriptional regulator with XRE-family HTH domain